MDVSEIVTSEYVSFDPSTRVSKLRGAFGDGTQSRVVVLEGEDGFEGVVPYKHLLSSHRDPAAKARSVMQHPPQVDRTEDVREVARLMVENDLDLLPAFEGEEFVGVVTDRDLLDHVRSNLDALAVEDVFTRDLIHVEPGTTIGEVINVLREHGITRVPVVDDDGAAIGLVSMYDLVDFVVREMQREQGGSHEGFDHHGGTGSGEDFHTHGGYGERAGLAARMLDLPARDVMNRPAETVEPDRPLGDATGRMLEAGYSSLVVSSPDVNWPLGIVTTTDVLRSLTWTDETRLPVQVFNVELLDDLSREAIAERIEEIDDKYAEMDVIEANVVLQKHRERMRGTPLLLVTVRLFTDRGRFTGSAEEYGARAAFDEAADLLEENVLEGKGRDHPREVAGKGRVDTEQLVGWWLGG